MFKCHAQLEKFFKRIVTSRDKTFDELRHKGLLDFVKSQESFGLPQVLTELATRVLSRAKAIVGEILGEFDYIEFTKYCSFGKKAARHLPLAESYLDVRVCRLGGSKTQQEWFKFCLGNDIHLNRACRRHVMHMRDVRDIELHAVPKAFDKVRIIAPDTTIGGFLSRGLGAYFRDKLEDGTKLNLASQQSKHKRIALESSLTGFMATLDETKASDSFVWDHIVALVPDSWLPVIDVVRTPKVGFKLIPEDENSQVFVDLRSVMLMGSGHTFPLQTLLFYSLTKAVIELSGDHTQVNVYGDDIICRAKLAPRVIICLEELGFTVNREKSFWTGHFRESCGGDYHTGVDVRPFMLEIDSTVRLSHHQYVALHHKIANGLMERWDPVEIPSTYNFILTHLLMLDKRINVVPDYEGADAGIKYVPLAYRSIATFPFIRDSILCYRKLSQRSKRRRPKGERVYYWYALRPKGKTDPFVDDSVSRLDKRGSEVMKGSHRYGWVANWTD
jgi:hypothetical protein